MRLVVLCLLALLASQQGCSSPPPPPLPVAIHRRPPARPTTSVTGERRWYVLWRVWLGLRDRTTEIADTNAWREYGYDLDLRITTKDDSKTSVNSCKRLSGSPTGVLLDGVEGIDNNFGQHTLSVIKSMKADAEDAANGEMTSGNFTLLLRVDGATDGDNATAPGALFAAGPLGRAPTFAPAERWPVWDSTVNDGDLERPVRTFPRGYVSNGVWVSGEIGEPRAPIWIPIMTGPVELRATTILTLDLRDGRGVIAGAIPEDELVRAIDSWAVKYDMCRDLTYDQVVSTVTAAMDLVNDERDLQNPERPCNALSIGMGFDAVRGSAPIGIVAAPPPPPPMKDCLK